jgi:hypothetical protein
VISRLLVISRLGDDHILFCIGLGPGLCIGLGLGLGLLAM